MSHDQHSRIEFHINPGAADEARCIEHLHDALLAEPGVRGLTLDVPAGRLQLRYDPGQTSPARVQLIASELGVELGKRLDTCQWRLQGVRCADCSLGLERELVETPGVTRVVVNPAATTIGVEYDSLEATLRTLEQTIKAAGYTVHPPPRTRAALQAAHALESAERRRMAILTGVCLTALVSGWLVENLTSFAAPWAYILYAISYVAGGWFATAGALRELRARSINVDLLMVAAALGAALVNEAPEGAILLFLFSFSSTLEKYVLGYTRRAIEALMNLTPEEAVVLRDGAEQRLPVEQLVVGDTLIVRPGERIAADGVISEGQTSIDQSMITGESIPAEKGLNDQVFAATVNQNSAIRVRVTRLAGETALARIIQLVEEAQSEKAHSQRFTDWFGERYTLAVLGLSALTLIVPLALGIESFGDAFYRAMTVLVVASPCAVVISIPAAILSAITSGARGGVLFKGGAHLERAAGIRAVAFDKTGTLTIGRPSVVDIRAMPGLSDNDVLQLAASAELLSEHPLARAVVDAAMERKLPLRAASHLEALVGRGIKAQLDGHTAYVGKAELFSSVPDSLIQTAVQQQAAGRSTVFVGDERGAVGIIAIADVLRPSAAEAIRQLQALGITRLVMLTGDNERVAQAIAGTLGMDFAAQLMPDDKLNAIHRLRSEVGPVAMIGDGINDAPSLATADVGISLSATGTDVALETADLVLMADDLRHLPYAIRLARAAEHVIRQNLVFAFGMMLLLLVTTYFGNLRLPFAVVGHEGSTVLVILNGLRLLAFKRSA
jgi:Cd2+/Zn2+-exporting ATPase